MQWEWGEGKWNFWVGQKMPQPICIKLILSLLNLILRSLSTRCRQSTICSCCQSMKHTTGWKQFSERANYLDFISVDRKTFAGKKISCCYLIQSKTMMHYLWTDVVYFLFKSWPSKTIAWLKFPAFCYFCKILLLFFFSTTDKFSYKSWFPGYSWSAGYPHNTGGWLIL